MTVSRVLILGGTGFVGRHVCEALQRLGIAMTVPTRHPSSARRLAHLPLVTTVVANVNAPDALMQLVPGHDAVVNLVAILHGSRAAFERVHLTLAQRLAAACGAAGVRRVVHVSALGAHAHAPSNYQRSKAAGEEALRRGAKDHGWQLTVLRPSVIFGADDALLNQFALLQRWLPLLPLAGGNTRFQPVWVQDVAEAVTRLLRQPEVTPLVDAVGPETLTLAQLARVAGRASGHPRMVWPLPRWVGHAQAAMLAPLPGPPLISHDNVRSLAQDNVRDPQATHPDLHALGIEPVGVLAMASQLLRRHH
jgi:uncharacterized protein YbjT (DUF2867 family)